MHWCSQSPDELPRVALAVCRSPATFHPASPVPCSAGYWKTHPEDWPEPAKSSGLVLGSNPGVSYTQSQLITIMNTPVNVRREGRRV